MSVLRITDREVAEGHRRVEVLFTPDGGMRRSSESTFEYVTDASDSERIRWYLEEYPEFPAHPAPKLAKSAETQLAVTGEGLFRKIFSPGDAAGVWARLVDDLAGVRVEVDADPGDVSGLPWELLRDPGTGSPVALSAQDFVRTHLQALGGLALPDPDGDRLRVLLVICRPGGPVDVPFRSVASQLIRTGAGQMAGLDLDVLRPPTYTQLAKVLQGAKEAGRPYHVVHFDGHGTFLNVATLTETTRDADHADDGGTGPGGVGVSPVTYAVSLAAPARHGSHGYLLFENPDSPTNQMLVDGPTVGRLLLSAQVPVLVLNACRSAYTEAQNEPTADADAQATVDGTSGAAGDDPLVGDVHARVRAFGSLAAEVADAGVPGVVAMRYNVYVVTAAQFVADLYAHLLAGKSLGQAATSARRALADNPCRQIVSTPVDLQDWVVPTVYEATPLVLLTPARRSVPLISIGAAHDEHTGAGVEVGVPQAPAVGFFGRDETLLALDRALDTHPMVLLHAYAGSGKSTTAAEFARWYQATGGLDHPQHREWGPGPILWTSFEHHTSLSEVLNTVGDTFADVLKANGFDWYERNDLEERRVAVLQVLAQMPVLWVWDNVEPVSGFPAGTPSVWSTQEQNELVVFLRDLAVHTRCKVVLTSRRDEQDWLGDLATRVKLPPMKMRESLQLTAAIIARRAQDAPRDLDWHPLLRYTLGNPLTITILIGLALREHLATNEEIEGFLARVRAGEVALEGAEDAALGRTRSLAASLDYGFANAFTDNERGQLAVLHLFRNTVNVDALRFMGDAMAARGDVVSVLAGLTREAGISLLDRAVEVGLLSDLGGGYYGIHPALPWYLTTQFTLHHGTPSSPPAETCKRAFARALAITSAYYLKQSAGGYAAAVTALSVEEANLLHALHLARRRHVHDDAVVCLHDDAFVCLQGLEVLYNHTGRGDTWARLLDEVTPDYLDPATDRPLPGREGQYSSIAHFRICIARDRGDWATAARLQQACTDWDRQQAEAALAQPPDQLGIGGRSRIRSLMVSLQSSALILYKQHDQACLPVFLEALHLSQRISDRNAEATFACDLGNVYLSVPSLRDLDKAQHWHQRSFDLRPEHDRLGRAASHGNLGNVAYQRLLEARATGDPELTLMWHLNAALDHYQQSRALTPADHPAYLGNVHHQLGVTYSAAGDPVSALRHYQRAIRYKEACGDIQGAGGTRLAIAALHARAALNGDVSARDDAKRYAIAALEDFCTVGAGAAASIAKAQEIIRDLGRMFDGPSK